MALAFDSIPFYTPQSITPQLPFNIDDHVNVLAEAEKQKYYKFVNRLTSQLINARTANVPVCKIIINKIQNKNSKLLIH